MDLVIDANEIFAALIKESKTHELIFDERLHLLTEKTEESLIIYLMSFKRETEQSVGLFY